MTLFQDWMMTNIPTRTRIKQKLRENEARPVQTIMRFQMSPKMHSLFRVHTIVFTAFSCVHTKTMDSLDVIFHNDTPTLICSV